MDRAKGTFARANPWEPAIACIQAYLGQRQRRTEGRGTTFKRQSLSSRPFLESPPNSPSLRLSCDQSLTAASERNANTLQMTFVQGVLIRAWMHTQKGPVHKSFICGVAIGRIFDKRKLEPQLMRSRTLRGPEYQGQCFMPGRNLVYMTVRIRAHLCAAMHVYPI